MRQGIDTLRQTILSLLKRIFRCAGHEREVAAKVPRADDIRDHLGAVVSHEPGLSCPKCRFRIQIGIPMLLSGQPVICPKCFLRLDVDREQSKESLQALEKLQAEFGRAQKMMK